jgi:hypothetical protein
MADRSDAVPELSDEEWELQVAKIPLILRPKDFRTIPSWMLYHYGSLPKRFDTHFFLASMPDQQEAAHDQLETTAGVWITPHDALAGFARGEFPIVFATIHQLQELAQLERLEDAWQRFGGRIPRTIMPRVVQRDGADVIVLPDEE